ncbi:MAG: PDZ domain-containing protein [Clostridiales bacterium]|nr:PDZ domain-containing protein [Clostridiales bacterium]
MSDDIYNNNPDYNRNQPEPIKKVPEYSFWAEQMTHKDYTQYNKSQEWTAAGDYGSIIDSTIANENNKKGKKVFTFILKAICFGIIASISFIGFQKVYYYINPEETIQLGQDRGYSNIPGKTVPKLNTTHKGNVTMKDNTIISEVVDNTMPAIVSIRSIATQTYNWFGRQFDDDYVSNGSGFIISKTDKELLIATNNHVVEGANQIIVSFIDGSEATAVIKGTDSSADLAVITVELSDMEEDTLGAIKVAELGDSDDVKVGQMAIAIGNALGYGQSVTVGYISAIDRNVAISDRYSNKTMVLLQTDAAINPGNSGGALLNVEGKVIGINTVKYSANEVEGMGYAIPITRAIPIINELMNREVLTAKEQGFLGINITDVTEEISKQLSMPIGVMVYAVEKGSAADKGGLVYGDIITKINDIEVTSSMQLKEKIQSTRAGSEVKIVYMRNIDGTYQEFETTVVLGTNPNVN